MPLTTALVGTLASVGYWQLNQVTYVLKWGPRAMVTSEMVDKHFAKENPTCLLHEVIHVEVAIPPQGLAHRKQ